MHNMITIPTIIMALTPLLTLQAVTCDLGPSNDPPDCKACPDNPNFTPINVTADMLGAASPYFFLLQKRTETTVTYDSQCNTYLAFANNTYLVFLTATRKDNTSFTELYFVKNSPQGFGTFEIVGLSGPAPSAPLMVYGYVLSNTCEGSSELFNCVTFTVAQGCDAIPNIFNPNFAIATTLHPDPKCVAKSTKVLESRAGKNNIIMLPGKMRSHCVATYQGMPTINIDRILNNPEILPISYP